MYSFLIVYHRSTCIIYRIVGYFRRGKFSPLPEGLYYRYISALAQVRRKYFPAKFNLLTLILTTCKIAERVVVNKRMETVEIERVLRSWLPRITFGKQLCPRVAYYMGLALHSQCGPVKFSATGPFSSGWNCCVRCFDHQSHVGYAHVRGKSFNEKKFRRLNFRPMPRKAKKAKIFPRRKYPAIR